MHTGVINLYFMKNKRKIPIGVLLSGLVLITSCYRSSDQEMIQILKDLNRKNYSVENPFNPEVKKAFIDYLLKSAGNKQDYVNLLDRESVPCA